MADQVSGDQQQQTPPRLTAQGRYSKLTAKRDPVLARGRECSQLTIPALLPPEGTDDASRLSQPFQSVGAKGVNNLSSKLLLALFPPGSSFFRLKVEEFLMDKLAQKAQGAGEGDPKGEIEAALSKIERAVITRLEQKAVRPVLSEFFKHLIVVGNGLLQVLPKGGLKFFPLSTYVVKRDGEGEPVEILLREGLGFLTLPAEAQEIVEQKNTQQDQKKDTDTLWLYTWVQRQENGSWIIHQEILDTVLPSTQGTYPKDKSPWIAARWSSISGSDYGRGHCEDYLGDLHSLEAIAQSIVEFAANAAKVVWIVDEGGVTKKKKLAEAPSGAIIDGAVSGGKPKDVGVLALEKFADFQVVKSTGDDIHQRLKEAFLLNSSIQRQAERVTAEEIRFMAGELEQALGGTYSILGQEVQRPLVIRVMLQMQKERALPALPNDTVQPQIITGLDGLGRSSDLMKLDLLLQGIAQSFGPEAVAEYYSAGAYGIRRAAALGIDIDGIVRTEAQVQQIRSQNAQQALLQRTAPAGIKAMSDQAKVAAQQNADANANNSQQPQQ